MEGQRIPNMTHPDVPIGSEDVATLRKEVMMSFTIYLSHSWQALFDCLPYMLKHASQNIEVL